MKYSGNGAYLFVLNGSVEVDGNILQRRDAAGIYDTGDFEITASENTEFIVINIPMN